MSEYKVRIEVILEGNNKKLESLIKAIKPDNVNVPENISIEEEVHKDKAIIVVNGIVKEPKDVLRIRNTVDDLLEHLILSHRVIETVKDN